MLLAGWYITAGTGGLGTGDFSLPLFPLFIKDFPIFGPVLHCTPASRPLADGYTDTALYWKGASF